MTQVTSNIRGTMYKVPTQDYATGISWAGFWIGISMFICTSR